MKTLSKENISKLISTARMQKNENLESYVGSGNNKRLILSPGLKIKHKDTFIVYTIQDINMDGDDISIQCTSDGKDMVIPSKEFKNYERQ
jgi:hypothetical protein